MPLRAWARRRLVPLRRVVCAIDHCRGRHGVALPDDFGLMKVDAAGTAPAAGCG